MDVALKNSVWVTSPEFSGYLHKKGFRWRKLWKKRWVALHGTEVAYMEREPEANTTHADDIVLMKANIIGSTIIDREDIEGHELGFTLHINDGTNLPWHMRAETLREKKSWIMRLMHVHTIVRWLEEFEKIRILGVGGTGIVHELLHKRNGERYAMKEMEIRNRAQMTMAMKEAEMVKDIMENVSHPNILHIEKVFQVGSKFYLVFPLCTGGELYEHVISKGHFTERDAAVIIRDLVSGLHALHSTGILHLDIKPENILFESNEPDARIRITDFGLSKLFGDRCENSRDCPTAEELAALLRKFEDTGILNRQRLRGTVGYMSPELILAGHASAATDVWAVGVVLYILLSGQPPFQSKSNREVLEKSARGEVSLDGPQWTCISRGAIELIQRMLTVDPTARITTAEILANPWVRASPEDLELGVVGEEVLGLANDGSGSNNNSNAAGLSLPAEGVNLVASLKNLSAHVSRLRTEKMSKVLSKVFSNDAGPAAESPGGGNSRLFGEMLARVPHAARGVHVGGVANSMTNIVTHPEIRAAVASAFELLGSNGRISHEQFAKILKHFGVAGRASESIGLHALMLCKFMDRDGDGLIGIDDIYQTQAEIMQRSERFMRGCFRLYQDALWYPGRQLNKFTSARKVQSRHSQDLKQLSTDQPSFNFGWARISGGISNASLSSANGAGSAEGGGGGGGGGGKRGTDPRICDGTRGGCADTSASQPVTSRAIALFTTDQHLDGSKNEHPVTRSHPCCCLCGGTPEIHHQRPRRSCF